MSRLAAIALVAVSSSVFAVGCGPEPTAPRDPDAGAPRVSATPFDGQVTGGRVRRLTTRGDVPLGGHRLDARDGDWLIESDTSVAVVSAAEGRIIGFGKRGGDNGLVYVDPTAFIELDSVPRERPRIEDVDGRILHLTSRVKTEPLELHVWLSITDDRLTIASQLHNVGRERVLAVTLGERTAWSNTPTWLAGHGELLEGGSYGGAFLGRDGPGTAYALCNHDGRVMVKSSRPNAPGFHRTPSIGRDRVTIDPGDRSPIRKVTLSHADASVGHAALKLPCAGDREIVKLPAAVTSYGVEVAFCETARAHAARLARADDELDDEQRAVSADAPYAAYAPGPEIALPLGCARARLTRRGHAPGAFIDPRRDDATGWRHEALLPRAGRLAWRLRETGRAGALPAKIIVRGKGTTKTPNWGEDPLDGAARHFIYAHADGEIAIPPGSYELSVYRGFEYTRHVERIEVKRDTQRLLEAELERVVDTTGWISADLHVHAMPSWDAPARLEDRVRSLAGVGVEVGVATDHNAVTDYAPAIEALGLEHHVTSLIGDEVTTEATMLGHFNVFPLEPGSEPLAHEHVHPHDLFADARRRAHGGVIQVNHPRMGSIGYFELLHLDRGDVPGWAGRATLGDMSFDAIEVFNGDHYAKRDEVEWVLEDWYALLDAGMRHAATGNSDSHKVAYQDAGIPRNWIQLDRDAPDTFDGAAFIDSIRHARVVVSSGPFIRFTVAGRSIGATVDAGSVEVFVSVDAPPWIDVSQVEIVKRGHIIKRYDVAGRARPRFEKQLTLEVAPEDWLLVVAKGARASPNVYRGGALPFAFTNPIWVR